MSAPKILIWRSFCAFANNLRTKKGEGNALPFLRDFAIPKLDENQ